MPSKAAFGTRLLPTLIDQLAETDPDRVSFSYPKSTTLSDGFQDVTIAQFARAIDRCAWHLETRLGRGENFPTLLYLGPQDIMYGVLTVAAIKTGYQLLLIGLRNSLEANLNLLEDTNCNVFLMPPRFPLPVVKQILEARPMQVVEIESFPHWADDELRHKPYPYTKTIEEAKQDPFLVMHTSGSTGRPKPVIQRHGTWLVCDAYQDTAALGLPPTYPAICKGQRLYNGFPPFHTAGISMLLMCSIYYEYTCVLGPFPPTGETANAVHVHGNIGTSVLPPSVLVEIAKVPEHLENLSKLSVIAVGGGSTPADVGTAVSQRTKLINCLGSTETGIIPNQLPETADSSYISISPICGAEFRPAAGDLYEMVFVRKPQLEKYQAIFATFPELQEWPTKDLFARHPTEENAWLSKGRLDDILVLTTGEKLNPIAMEDAIGGHLSIRGVLVVGMGRTQTSLLLEASVPPATTEEKERLLEDLWPVVEKANASCAAFGRVHRDMIIIASLDKPFLRAGKGTIQRQLTIESYQSELDELYTSNEARTYGHLQNGTNGHVTHHLDAESAIRTIVAESTDIVIDGVGENEDLFALGLDSLQITLISRKINSFLAAAGSQAFIGVPQVYANATLARLTATVVATLHGSGLKQSIDGDSKLMDDMLKRCTMDLAPSGRVALTRPEQAVVLLTGATGSLGAYILAALSGNHKIGTIICLSRGNNSEARIKLSLESKKLALSLDKVVFLDGDNTSSRFGLSGDDYSTLLGKTTNIIHNAWDVNFNKPVSAFGNQVDFVRRLVDFSRHSAFGASILFVSSPAAIGSASGELDERLFVDKSTPIAMGYGQSKFLAENILDAASREAGVSATVCRVGQLTGAVDGSRGLWSKQEFIPSLICSSIHLGVIPESIGSASKVDWLPVDVAGRGLAELALAATNHSPASGAEFYHLVNPSMGEWKNLVPFVQEYSKKQGKALKTVSLGDWLADLRASEDDGVDFAKNPALKLLPFFESLAADTNKTNYNLSVAKALDKLPKLRELPPVGAEWMGMWLDQWAF